MAPKSDFLCLKDVSQEAVKEDCSNHMMKINVIHPNVAQEKTKTLLMNTQHCSSR
ncbi:unnamed protein product [Arctogadus glacialis]